MKKAFSLAEILVAMSVLTVLIAVLTPTIMTIRPSSKKILARSVYYTITTTVNDLIINPHLYPHIDDTTGDLYAGFNNKNDVIYQGRTYGGESKFVDLFINHLNVKDDVNTESNFCSDFIPNTVNSSGVEEENFASCKTVYLNNGIRWSFAVLSAAETDEDDELATRILIDTNGDVRPNCYEGKDGCSSDFEQFRVDIYNDGSIQINKEDTWALNSIKTSESMME